VLRSTVLNKTGVFVSASMGGGKSLLAAIITRIALSQGRKVASNIHLYPEKMGLPDFDTNRQKYEKLLIHLPNKVRASDLIAIGLGSSSYSSGEFGLVIIDEMFLHFQARDWSNVDNKPLIKWLTHSRKRGWNVIFLGQSTQIDNLILTTFVGYRISVKKVDFFGLLPIFYTARVYWGIETNRRDVIKKVFLFVWYSFYNTKTLGLLEFLADKNLPSAYNFYNTKEDLQEDICHRPYYLLTNELVNSSNVEFNDVELERRITWRDLKNISLRKVLSLSNIVLLAIILFLFYVFVWAVSGVYQRFIADESGEVEQVQASELEGDKVVEKTGCTQTSDFFLLASTSIALTQGIDSDLLLSLMRTFVPVVANYVEGEYPSFDVYWYDGQEMVDITSSVELSRYGWTSQVQVDAGSILLSRGKIALLIPFTANSNLSISGYGSDYNLSVPICNNFIGLFTALWNTSQSMVSSLFSEYFIYEVQLGAVIFSRGLMTNYTLKFLQGGKLVHILSAFQLQQMGWSSWLWRGGLLLQHGKHLIFLRF
jgi:hypothetical protein